MVYAITLSNGATLHDRGVHSYVALSVVDRGAQNPAILRKVSLGKCGHHAASAGSCDAQAHLIADSERETDPRLFDHAVLSSASFHDNVWTEARDFEPPWRIPVPQPIERAGRQKVDGCAVEEGSRRKRELGDGVSMVEAFEIGPVLFRLRRPRCLK